MMHLSKSLSALAATWLCTVCTVASGQSPITQPSAAQPRVVTLPPPPGPASTEVSTPPHVPLASPARGAGGSEANLALPTAEQPAAVRAQAAAPPLPPLPSGSLPAFPPASAVLPRPSSVPVLTQSPSPATPTSPVAPTRQNTALVAYGSASPAALAPLPEPEEFPAGRLIAVVGTEHVLAGDMSVFVEPIIEQNRDRISSSEEEKKIRSQLTRQALRQYCEVKAIYQEFFRDMVGTVPPKELAETKKKVVTRAGKIFFEKQVPVLMKKYEVATIQDLERKLQEKSLSLATLRGQFIEQVLASELERKYVPDKFEIDRQDLLDAYRSDESQDEWQVIGRARWRQVTVRFDQHATRQEAEAKIRTLGNEMLGGKAFEATARQSSEGYTADEGGVYDWTTQGSLKSQPLDEAIFSIPLNRLSQIIVDDIGLHIIEVLEREPGHVKDFTQAQAELRERLSDEKRNREVRAFRERIMGRTTIWTLWPEDIPDSRPLAAALGVTP